MNVSATKRLIVTLTDGRLIDAGMVPTAAGVPGERGAPGEKGEKGEKGDAGTSLVEFTMQNGNLIAAMSNGESKNLGSSGWTTRSTRRARSTRPDWARWAHILIC